MTASSLQEHEAHRVALATHDPLPAILSESWMTPGSWTANADWTRTYARFDPGAVPYCTMLYERACESDQALCVVELSSERPVLWHALEVCVAVEGFGWARVSQFPHDARLPTLERARTMAYDTAGACTVLRYRPRKRCTLLVGAPESDDGQIAKVFADDRGEVMHRDAIELSQAAARGELTFQVAQPQRWHAETRSLWQSRLAGKPLVSRLMTAEGEALATRLGAACASLTRTSLTPSLRIDGQTQLKRTNRYADELVSRLPCVADQVRSLLARLRDVHRHHDARPLEPVHGAPHPSQWLDDGTRLSLVDFDRLCSGHPEMDAATFMVEVEYHKRAVCSPAAINGAFVEAYQYVAGALDSALLGAYRAHKHLAKALKSARGIHADAERRVQDSLARADACLAPGAG